MNKPAKFNHNYLPVDDITMVKGKGIYLYDDKDNEYIDCSASTFNVSLGYGHPGVIDAVKEQLDKFVHISSSFQSESVNNLLGKLVHLTPPNITKVHLKVCSGSTANEGAIKMAQYATKKRGVISQFRSHLGQSGMMTSISGNAFRKKDFPHYYPHVVHVPDPYCYRCFYRQKPESCGMLCVERIRDFIEYSSCGQVACMIIEPISGNGGNIIPPHAYFTALRKLCDEYGIVLIFDEIQTGIGRTGKMFAYEHFGVNPNIITTAKGLGGIGFPVAAILAEERFAGLQTFHHSFTYGANSLAAAAACKTLDIISDPKFLENIRTNGAYILSRLQKMREKFRFIGDVRGLGLMIGVEIVDTEGNPDVELTNRFIHLAQRKHVLIRSSRYGFGNVFKIRPALTITAAECEMLCDKIEVLLGELA